MLRPYQQASVDWARNTLAQSPACLIQLATGGGKTVIFTAIIDLIKNRDKRVWLIVNRKQLLKQASQTLTRNNILHEVYNADSRTVPTYAVVVASVDTMRSRKVKPMAHFVIFDECHLTAFDDLAIDCISQGIKVLGFTATPVRNLIDAPSLESIYKVMYSGPAITQLIAEGYLKDAHTWGIKTDLSGLETKLGEYTAKSQDKVFATPTNFASVVKALGQHSLGANLVFTSSVAVSIELTDYLNNNGFKAMHLDGSYTDDQRNYVDNQLRTGEINTLVNCSLLTFGYDNPIINTIVVLRATKSLALWLQMCGRGSRPYEQQDRFHIIDFGGNTATHGHWQREHDWQHWFAFKKQKGKRNPDEIISPIQVCENCYYVFPANAAVCPACGFAAPMPPPKKPVDKEVAYIPFDGKPYKSIDFSKASIEELEAYRTAKGYHANWSAQMLIANKPKEDALHLLRMLGHKRGKSNLNLYAEKYYSILKPE